MKEAARREMITVWESLDVPTRDMAFTCRSPIDTYISRMMNACLVDTGHPLCSMQCVRDLPREHVENCFTYSSPIHRPRTLGARTEPSPD